MIGRTGGMGAHEMRAESTGADHQHGGGVLAGEIVGGQRAIAAAVRRRVSSVPSIMATVAPVRFSMRR